MSRKFLPFLLPVLLLVLAGCPSAKRINADLAHMVGPEASYDIAYTCVALKIATKGAERDPEAEEKMYGYVEEALLAQETFAGSKPAKMKSDKATEAVLKLFQSLDHANFAANQVSPAILKPFREKGKGDLLLLIKTDGYFQSGGKIFMNALLSSVVNVQVGNVSVGYKDTSKAAHSVFEYLVADKKSGKVVLYDKKERDATPYAKGVQTAYVNFLVTSMRSAGAPKKEGK